MRPIANAVALKKLFHSLSCRRLLFFLLLPLTVAIVTISVFSIISRAHTRMCVLFFSITLRLTIAMAKVICINLFLPPQHTIQKATRSRVLVSDIFMNGNHLLPINEKKPKTMKMKRENETRKKIKRTKGIQWKKRNYAFEKKKQYYKIPTNETKRYT